MVPWFMLDYNGRVFRELVHTDVRQLIVRHNMAAALSSNIRMRFPSYLILSVRCKSQARNTGTIIYLLRVPTYSSSAGRC